MKHVFPSQFGTGRKRLREKKLDIVNSKKMDMKSHCARVDRLRTVYTENSIETGGKPGNLGKKNPY